MDELHDDLPSDDCYEEPVSDEIYVNTDRWRASEAPEEVFTEAESNREWSYDIIGEEVDESGNVMYEVRWEDWARSNGTKTTWCSPSSINIDQWKKKQRKIRRDAAKTSLGIEVISTTDIHNVETYLLHDAYEEKLRRAEAMPRTNLILEIEKVNQSPAAQRSRLGKEWTKIAAQDKGAPISFVNTVDAEPVPDFPPGFLYLESQYKFASGVPRPTHMEDFLLKCSSRYCVDVGSCECQAASALVDGTRTPILAYTPDGDFAFNVPKGTEVVECNKLCGCSLKTCRNRVSQRPRDVPIEVFKTESRGWGVRAIADVRRGKVLGLYTGLVIPRETAHSHPDHVNSDYVFDLDGDENDEDNAIHHPLFSVDSMSCGNWTRFINHSCSPNLQIYLVVHDIPPENGLPFIAFVALTTIPAKTELTFDYNPRAADMVSRKGKKKGRNSRSPTVPEGAKMCCCGAESCRGFLF